MEVESIADHEQSEVLDNVFLTQLANGERMSVQHFRIVSGAVVGDHNHDHEQAGFLISGSLVFTVNGEEYPIEAGDSYVIPSNAVHAVENRGDEPAIGIELFSPPRPTPPWAEE
jgi:quercetin dioxygenase-like cupin family protein